MRWGFHLLADDSTSSSLCPRAKQASVRGLALP